MSLMIVKMNDPKLDFKKADPHISEAKTIQCIRVVFDGVAFVETSPSVMNLKRRGNPK